MLIPEQKIEEILERTDLVALISRHVELKKAGRSYKGCCPFHNEKTASFHVTPEMRRFKCFGCQAGGDAIAFVQRFYGKTFVDAVKDLAREAGVELTGAEDPQARERSQLKEVTAIAQTFFSERLWDEEAGRPGRAYLAQRGVPQDVAKAFGLGWAPAGWTNLADRLTRAGVLEWGVKAGLVQPRPRSDGYYDVFRGRLMVPIRSPEGRPIAFGGRLVANEEGPKYLNSRESKLFNKSEVLFGMDQAREEIRKRRSAILVEGYFDCIGLHQVGVTNAVALCSTALTPGHLALLGRSEAKDLVLLLDGDEAGRKAVERLAGPLLAQGAAVSVAVLPDGEDPDTFARKAGPNGVTELVAKAVPLSAHLFAQVLPKGKDASFEEKMRALDRVKPVASALPVGLTRSAFFSALSAAFGLPAAELEAALKGKAPVLKPVPKTAPPPAKGPGRPERPPDPLEAALTAAVLRVPTLIQDDRHRAADELRHAGLRGLIAQAGSEEADELIASASPLIQGAIERAAKDLPGEPAELKPAFAALCRRLKLRRIDEQLKDLSRVTAQDQAASDLGDETRRLLMERVELLALKRRIQEETD